MSENSNAKERNCSVLADEVNSDHPLTEIRRKRRLPRVSPSEDLEDAQHNVIVRILKGANEAKQDVATFMNENTKAVKKAITAERSRVRRRLKKAAKELTTEMEETLPADVSLSEMQSREVIAKAAKTARLSPRQSEWLHLYFTEGIDDVEVLSQRMKLSQAAVSRLKYATIQKLIPIGGVIEATLKTYENPVRPTPCEGGGWRQIRSRIL